MFPPGHRSPDPGGPSRQLGATCPAGVRAVTARPEGPLPSTLWRRHLRLFRLGSTHPALPKPVSAPRLMEQGPRPRACLPTYKPCPFTFLSVVKTDSRIPVLFHLFTIYYYFYFYAQTVPEEALQAGVCFLTFLLNFFSAVLSRLNLHSVTFTHCECVIQGLLVRLQLVKLSPKSTFATLSSSHQVPCVHPQSTSTLSPRKTVNRFVSLSLLT